MLTVALTIGFGNNLWQYAFGESLRARGHRVQYQFLNHSNPHTGPNYVNDHSMTPYGIALQVGNSSSQRFNERTFAYDAGVYDQPDGTLFVGNWQSEKYFTGIEEQIRKAFVFAGPFSHQVLAVAARLNQPNACFIHIRRGDYTLERNVEYHGDAGGMRYYTDAIQYLKARVPDVTFFLFSDDPKWCQENFPEIECISALGLNKYEDMFLMQQCEHAIIANSSFSWWAAYLGPDAAKGIIIAPRAWFNKAGLDCKDLIPSRWVKL